MYWLKRTPIIPKTKQVRKHKFKVGDHVCISHHTNIFSREYDEKFSGEFKGELHIYRLKNYLNEQIKGTCYQAKIQKVDVRKDDEFNVEKILKSIGRGPNKQYFIK